VTGQLVQDVARLVLEVAPHDMVPADVDQSPGIDLVLVSHVEGEQHLAARLGVLLKAPCSSIMRSAPHRNS
jgi:hypothetical protein